MSSLKVCAVLLLASILETQCSVLAPAIAAPPAVAVPAVRYSLVAPQNIRPFAAQVSTFTKGLNIYAAPYAAGVIGGPAIVPAPAPLYPGAAYPPVAPAVAPAPLYPGVAPAVAPAPFAPAVAPVPFAPAAPVVASAPLLPAPFARSIHAVAPGVLPAFGPPLPAAPYLG